MGTAAGTVGSTAPGGLAGAASAATPWVTMGLGAVNLATDLVQAGKQADSSEAARRVAEEAARKEEQLRSQDMFQALQMPMEQYNRAAKETTSQVAQAVGALQEGDPRFLPGALGKVVAAGIEGEAQTRDAAANDLFKIGVAQAQSGMDVNANLADLQANRLAGAQAAAAAAKQAEMGLYSGAAQAGAGIINQGLAMISPFGTDKQPTDQTAMSAGLGKVTQSAPQVPSPSQSLSPSWMNSLSFLKKKGV